MNYRIYLKYTIRTSRPDPPVTHLQDAHLRSVLPHSPSFGAPG
jgi:hypothetical protein